jgi:hypothetical protein
LTWSLASELTSTWTLISQGSPSARLSAVSASDDRAIDTKASARRAGAFLGDVDRGLWIVDDLCDRQHVDSVVELAVGTGV